MPKGKKKRKQEKGLPGVYRILCKSNGKMYFGHTMNLLTRISGHITFLQKGIHANKALQSDWNLFGEWQFTFTIFIVCQDTFFYERRAVQYYRTYLPENGYNNRRLLNREEDKQKQRWNKETKRYEMV